MTRVWTQGLSGVLRLGLAIRTWLKVPRFPDLHLPPLLCPVGAEPCVLLGLLVCFWWIQLLLKIWVGVPSGLTGNTVSSPVGRLSQKCCAWWNIGAVVSVKCSGRATSGLPATVCSGLKQSQANGFSDLCELMMSNKNPLQSHLPRECCGDQGSCCNPQSLGVRTGSVCWNCCGLGLFLSPCIEPGVQMLSLVPALSALWKASETIGFSSWQWLCLSWWQSDFGVFWCVWFL